MAMTCHYAVLMCLFFIVFSDETNAEVEFHRITVVGQGVEVMEDVLYDKDNKAALVTVTGDPDKNICQSSNFHDLERQLLAIKDVATGRCYLVHTEETTSQLESVFRNGTAYNPKFLSYKVRKDSVPVEHLEAQAGKKIANFCKEYDTKWLVKEPIFSKERRLRAANRHSLLIRRPCKKWCIVCVLRVKE